MPQPVLEITAAQVANATQSSQNAAMNGAALPTMPDLSSVQNFNEIFAGTLAGATEFEKLKKLLASFKKSKSMGPTGVFELQQGFANLSVEVQIIAKVAGFFSTALRTLNGMQ